MTLSIIQPTNQPHNTNQKIQPTNKHRDKMDGMRSIACSSMVNDFCQKHSSNCHKVCHVCYGLATEENISKYQKAWERNSILLSTSILTEKNFIKFKNLRPTRLDSFGELHNTIHLINYFNLCNYNSKVQFTLWTKRNNLVNEVIDVMGIAKPKNLILIYSSPKINKQANIKSRGLRHFDKVFTVFTHDFVKENNIEINCQKKCLPCLICYSDNDILYVNELVKSSGGYTSRKNKV